MLSIAGHLFDAQLVIFDKDGTLIAFDAMWHTWFIGFMAAIKERIGYGDAFLKTLGEVMGYDPETDEWDPLGPLTLASTGEVALLVAGQVYALADVTWNEALRVVADAEDAARGILEDADLAQPIGPVGDLMGSLTERGILVAVATTDTRRSAEGHLDELQLTEYVSALSCGDDGIPLKPAADMALTVCQQLGIAPEKAIMVGDTVSDLEMAEAAGLAGGVGVASGAVPGEMLAPHATVVVPDIHAIRVVDNGDNK